MNSPLFNRVAILGLGLIGSSLARSMTQKNLAGHIAAFDKSHSALAYGLEHEFIHSHYPYAGDAVENADLIILATPPSRLKKLMHEIAPFIKGGAILMDVASVKRQAIADINSSIPAYAYYVPAHPIAGSEKKGAAHGLADLFENKLVIFTPKEQELTLDSVKKIEALWNAIGSKVIYMPPDLHDRLYAYISHLPQLLAFAATPCMEEAATNPFKRLGQSDTKLWTDIFLHNTDYVLEGLNDYLGFLVQISGELLSGETASEIPATAQNLAPADLFSHIVSTCLIASCLNIENQINTSIAPYTGRGFADMTAPAAKGDAQTIFAAISANPAGVMVLLHKLQHRLHEIKLALIHGKVAELNAALS